MDWSSRSAEDKKEEEREREWERGGGGGRESGKERGERDHSIYYMYSCTCEPFVMYSSTAHSTIRDSVFQYCSQY